MFAKIQTTAYPPGAKPVLIWDGERSFCKYWVIHLRKYTKHKVTYRTYQEAGDRFPDIPLMEFRKASRLIEGNGNVFSGPDSLYRSLEYSDKRVWPWHSWYHKYAWFEDISDHGYTFIAKNRSGIFKITKALFGKSPERLKPYWLVYMVVFAFIICIII